MLSIADFRALPERRPQADLTGGGHAGRGLASGPSSSEAPAADSGLHEKHVAVRLPAAAVPEIRGLRLSPPGAEAGLLNISTSGLLAECAFRLQPGTAVTVVIDGAFEPSTIRGRVARAAVAALGAGGGLLYHVGIAFSTPITLKHPESPDTVALPSPALHDSAPAAVLAPTPAANGTALRNRW